LLAELFAYDPAVVDPEIRAKMADILKARGEILRASAEVSDLRARSWAGEEGLTDFIDLKAQDLAKLRDDYGQQMIPFVKDSVDVDGLMGMLPMFGIAVLQNFKVPPMLLLEALDIDNIKMVATKLKSLVDE